MEPHIADIGNYDIAEDAFDYIVAVSTLEHIDSLTKLDEVLLRMNHGTKDRGMNCIIMNTNITELDRDTGQELEPQMEINMSTNQAKQLLAKAYRGWHVLEYNTKPLRFDIERNGRDVILSSDCMTYVVRKQVNA